MRIIGAYIGEDEYIVKLLVGMDSETPTSNTVRACRLALVRSLLLILDFKLVTGLIP